MTNNTARAKRIETIQRLLAQAASTNFPAEAETFRNKAAELMMENSVEEWELAQATKGRDVRYKPEYRKHKVVTYDRTIKGDDWYVWREMWVSLAGDLARHFGMIVHDGYEEVGLFGYPGDHEHFDLMMAVMQMEAVNHLFPTWDPNLSDGENYHRFKSCGMKWDAMHQIMMAIGHRRFPQGEMFNPLVGRRMYNEYKKWLKISGVDQVTENPDVWRRSYLTGFRQEIRRRLASMKQARDNAKGGLVLVGRDSGLKELYWEQFPDQRPHPSGCECDSCHFLRCSDESCTRPRCKEYWRNKDKPVRARAWREPIMSGAALKAGQAAASTISFGDNEVNG